MIPKCRRIEKKFDYSTTEQIIGKWIDGKALYRKIIYIENFSIESNEEKRVKHNIENLQDFTKLNICVLTGWGRRLGRR